MIDTADQLKGLLHRVRAAEWIAVDTEADSLHAYPEKLCLLQLSFEGEDALVDPLAQLDLQPLLRVFHKHELIFHGADYDLRLLRKTFDFVPSTIFDTMLASRLLGCREFGLVNLVERYLGVRLEKGPQKADWARRPLTPRMEAYARNDTHYLKPLADLLRGELIEKGRLAWHQEACARLIVESAVVRAPDPELVWRVKGSHLLTSPALAVLRELWRWREREATAANKPPYFILPPETMIKISVAAVDHRSWQEHLPRRFSHRRHAGVTKAVEAGLQTPHKPERLRHHHRRLSETERKRFHELERHRDKRAAELGLDPSLVASRATLLGLVGAGEENGELMGWQRDLLQP